MLTMRPRAVADVRPASLRGLAVRLAGRVDAGAAVLVVLPWLVLLADPLWVYASLYRDAWAYTGFFQNLPGYLTAYGDHYSAGRLGMLLPGAAVYALLAPAAANAALHIGVYSVGVLSGYVALGRTVGRRAAFLAMAALGTHAFYLRACGWDYCDGYVIAYFLLGMALATQAARPGWWRAWAAAFGAAAAAILATHVGFATLLIPLAGFFVLTNRLGERHSLEVGGFWAGAGFGGAMAAFALASRLFGGPLVFLLSSFNYIRTFGPESTAQFVHHPRLWAGGAWWLVLPAAAVVGAVVGLLRAAAAYRRGAADRGVAFAAYFQVQLLVIVGLLAVKQLRVELAFLQYWLSASVLAMLPAFLALGGQLRGWANGFTPARFRVQAGVWCLVLVAGCLTADRLHLPGWGAWLPIAAALGCAIAAVLLPQGTRPRLAVGVMVAVLLALVSLSARTQFRMAAALIGVERASRVGRAEAFDDRRKAAFAAALEVARWARDRGPTGTVWFWYDLNAPLAPAYDMAAHTSYHYLQLVSVEFPAIKDDKLYRGDPIWILAKGGTVVVFSEDPAAGDVAVAELRKKHLDPRVEERRAFGRGAVVLTATIVHVPKTEPDQ
ncbi:MAG: hypothetical protein K2X87_34440 [Gemmataceae bacterium]|nr:hypothetical protein [Gemmataceae bacterium]